MIRVDEKFERMFKATQQHSAVHLGSGDVNVFSTPSMIQFMEETCRLFADEHLPQDLTTVGIHVDVYHVKPAPVNSEITVKGKVLSIDGKRIVFWVEAWWKDVKIGHGIHERYIINRQDFIKRLSEAMKK